MNSSGACRRRFGLAKSASSGSCRGSSTKVAKGQHRVVTASRRDAAGFFGLHEGCNDLGEGSAGVTVATQFGEPCGASISRAFGVTASRVERPVAAVGFGACGECGSVPVRIASNPTRCSCALPNGPAPAHAHDSVRNPGRPPAKPQDRSIQWRVQGDCGSTSMTKAELVAQVAQDVLVTRREADRIVETVVSSIVNTLRKGEKVEIRGFGSFRTRTRKARTGRNPRSGESVYVPPKTVPFFKPSKQLRDAVLDANPTES